MSFIHAEAYLYGTRKHLFRDKDLSGLLLGSEVSWGVSMASDLRVTYPTHLLDRDLQYLWQTCMAESFTLRKSERMESLQRRLTLAVPPAVTTICKQFASKFASVVLMKMTRASQIKCDS